MKDVILDEKYKRLHTILAELKSVAVAFSAGVDSTFVLKAALDALGTDRVAAVTARSPSVAGAELEEAKQLAKLLGARHHFLDTDEFENPNYITNPTNRCYYCKTTLYGHMRRFADTCGLAWIVNGTNTDDLGDWRPGLVAANEHGVRAPAAEAGLSKAEIRELSQRLSLPTFDKPASPCLSSRVPYGQTVTPAKLRMIEEAEAFLRRELGMRECRVRHYGDEARVEVPIHEVARVSAPEVFDRIESQLTGLGFARVSIDPKGFRSGSLNEVIAFGQRQDEAATLQ